MITPALAETTLQAGFQVGLQAGLQAGAGLAAGALMSRISLNLPADAPLLSRPEPSGSGPAPRGRRLLCFALAAALLGGWAGLAQPGWAGLAGAVMAWQLLLLAVVDAEHFWLPDSLTLPLAATGLLAAALTAPHLLAGRAVGAAVGFGGLWLLAFAYRRLRGRDGLGGGDPFLLAGVGAWLGWVALPSVLLWASLAGLCLALVLAVTRRTVSLSTRLPFGTFLALGAWLTWLMRT